MSGGVLNAAMLLGLLGAAAPLAIHFWNRRHEPIVDWGAMQFLELAPRDQHKLRLNELVLMLARMGLLGLVALALARPFWSGAPAVGSGREGEVGVGAGFATTAPPRDVVLVVDVSASMDRRHDGVSLRDRAIQWAREFVAQLRPGDTVAVLTAGDRVRGLVDPPSFDRARLDAALAGLKTGRSRAGSDLPAALAEAFRILERTDNPARHVILLTDNQRFAWRATESDRWALLHDILARRPAPPRIWSLTFADGASSDTAGGSLGPLSLSRPLIAPGMPVEISTTLANTGPAPLTRTAELLLNGQPVPGSAQVAGPVPAGGTTRLSFRTNLPTPGTHLLAVQLVGGHDSLAVDDEVATPIEVAASLPVLLVDGEPGLEPFDGETDFLRAALAPTGDDAPLVRTWTITLDAFTADSVKGQRVLVLANVERLTPEQAAAVDRFLQAGGGLLLAPGDRTDAESFNKLPWIPAQLGELKQSPEDRITLAQPDPSTFAGSQMESFARGDAPPLAEADFFAYRRLSPVPDALVTARLKTSPSPNTGDPWVVERSLGKARVLLLATPLDAEAGTLPVNADFVPLVHEWIFHLAGHRAPHTMAPGEPWVLDLDPPPDRATPSVSFRTPGGVTIDVPIVRAGETAQARLEATSEPGLYRATLPDPPGGFVYASVASDPRESDQTSLVATDMARLADGWPLVFEPDPSQLIKRLREADVGGPGRREVWRPLILAALAGLCLEVYLTRRLVRSQGDCRNGV